MSDSNPFEELIRQLEYEVEQIKLDISLITNEEIRVMARNVLFDKRNAILQIYTAYTIPEGGEK